jgi:hypothetical protein
VGIDETFVIPRSYASQTASFTLRENFYNHKLSVRAAVPVQGGAAEEARPLKS